MQIMTTKTTTIRTPYVHVVLNGAIFPRISSDIVPFAWHFTCQAFPILVKAHFIYLLILKQFIVHDPASFQLLYISCINKGNLPTYVKQVRSY